MAKAWAKAFYRSRTWQSCREAYISNRRLVDGGMCEQCHKDIGIELHHKTHLTPANIDDPQITLNHDNLIWLCKDCHFKAHREAIIEGFARRHPQGQRITNNGVYVDDDGNIKPIEVHVVYGSPASGKTTYVVEHKTDGDLIIDLDMIKQAISGADKTNAPDNLLPLAIGIRDYLYKRIAAREIDCRNAWVIASLPCRKDMDELAYRLHADLIYIEATYHECIARANADGERTDKIMQQYLIDKWFDAYEE